MSAQSAQLAPMPRGIRRVLNRREFHAVLFGNSALMASTRNGGVADTHDRAVPVKASALLAFAPSEEQ
ncbi:hypothetical protein [Mycetocola zhadangensis]|uniref:Uncharacterized protein n=1 Tax=Mycetocola zhadangensis TaxID=1164595 RepID=A0A3L7J517_9MICO|nr:hypothetical protein [Mycetocola zhadangensis]RLQ85624.1 hypothetical protein D9V28_01725 [Mycetocola zhadangensis]GGE84248.1 hypothetical protein GCM10011313_03410 [Mycetocola zhadangensis]